MVTQKIVRQKTRNSYQKLQNVHKPCFTQNYWPDGLTDIRKLTQNSENAQYFLTIQGKGESSRQCPSLD